MTFYQELQLNQAGSKNLLKKSETTKEKMYHILVYLIKIAVTMVFCFLFVTVFSILFGNENSIVGVVVLLCLMVFRNADLGIHTGQSTMLLAMFFVIMVVCPHLANQLSPVLGMLLNIAALAVLIFFGCHNPFMFNQSTLVLGYLLAVMPDYMCTNCPLHCRTLQYATCNVGWYCGYVSNFAVCGRHAIQSP